MTRATDGAGARSGRLRVLGQVLVVGSGLVALPLVVLNLVPTLQAVNRPLAVAACGIAYLPAPLATLALGLLLLAGRWSRLAGVGVLVLALALGTAPGWRFPTGSTPRPTADDLVVLDLNTEFGQADPTAVLALAADADVLAFQEYTPEFETTLEELGLLRDFPYRAGTVAYESYGTRVWSRTPLETVAVGRTRYTSLVVRTTVHGTLWDVATLHAISPRDGSRLWEADGALVADLLRPYVGGRLVVVGDFNAVDEHLTLRRIRGLGLDDAMSGWPQGSGDGWQQSWPAISGTPTLVRIDHALHSASVQAWRPRYLRVSGTDHLALVTSFRAR